MRHRAEHQKQASEGGILIIRKIWDRAVGGEPTPGATEYYTLVPADQASEWFVGADDWIQVEDDEQDDVLEYGPMPARFWLGRFVAVGAFLVVVAGIVLAACGWLP